MRIELVQKIIDKIRGKNTTPKSNTINYGVARTDTPCHRKGLFIRENGDIYPCCRIGGIDNLKIGHLTDADFMKKLENFNGTCQCYSKNLIKGTSKDNDWHGLNIEFSYKCQAKCAMCCVDAPNYNKEYTEEYFDGLERLTALTKPKVISVQGGEILIQKDTIEWIKKIKNKQPEISWDIVTNGNNIKALDEALELFDSFTVSICGFQDETYKKIMGLNIENTKTFCEKIIQADKKVFLKFLTLPSNLHEIGLFLNWAMPLKPSKGVVLDNAQTIEQININGPFGYWDKVIERTKKDIENILGNNSKNNTTTPLYLTETFADLFKIDKSWTEKYDKNIKIF